MDREFCRLFCSIGSRMRDGDLAAAEELNDLALSWYSLEVHSRAIVGSAKVCWVVDISDDFCLREYFWLMLDSRLRLVNAVQASINDWLKAGETRRAPMYSFSKFFSLQTFVSLLKEPSEPSLLSYAVAVVLLSLIFQYLTGNVDGGGSKAYSRRSLDFRDIYISIVLFHGAYVWIKFREVALKGVHRKIRKDKQGGTKWMYYARLTPPDCNGKKLEMGWFATPQEAHNLFLIAYFYFNKAGGLLDGWFQVPPMSEEERSLTGLELRERVKVQAKKVYEDFKKKETEAALEKESSEACEDQVTHEQDEVNVNPCGSRLLNSASHQQPALASQAENSGMGMAMPDNRGLECASHSFGGMHEGLALSNGQSLGFQEGSTLPVSQLPSNSESGMSWNGSDQLDSLQTRVYTQQKQIDLQLKQISDQQQQINLQQQQIQELGAQVLKLQNQQPSQQQQQLQEPRFQNPQWPHQFYLQEQQLPDVNQEFSGFEVEMEQNMFLQNYP